MDYFFFGSLRDTGVLSAVIGCADSERLPPRIRLEPGTLVNYRAHRVVDEDYPLLVPFEDAAVPGLIVGGMTECEIDRIRFFEDAHYAPSKVTIQLADGRLSRSCLAFLSFDQSEDSGVPWNYDNWPVRDRRI
ncbi:MAG: gamma-glutamylcyclotransferase family protein, partial [Kiloniellales bacterium]|nr:gamma-glutamylcyclotransferase family protein [Kiloniellales bacterium]